MKLTWPTVIIAVFAHPVTAFWRMPVRFKTGVGRIDPIVSPGAISNHAHVVFGGGNFGPNADFTTLVNSNCTSAGVYEDKSAYWTPGLYFQFDNGTTELVDTVGGMLAYYLLYLDNLTAFPEGFRMLAGNTSLRYFPGPFPDTPLSTWPTDPDPNNQTFLQQRALGFNCLNYAKPPEPSLYRHEFPSKEYMDANCTDGLRLEFAFPSCGNGSLDSADHESHVKYPSLVKEGNCPSGYDVHYPFLYFETIYDTYAYVNASGQFLLATGDPVGTSYHGDFMMGWESAAFLQDAVDTCTNLTGEVSDCPLFTLQSDADASQCQFTLPSDLLDDDVFGPRDGLPVDVPVQYGPEPATKYPVAGANGIATSSVSPGTTPSSFELPTQSYTSATTSMGESGDYIDASPTTTTIQAQGAETSLLTETTLTPSSVEVTSGPAPSSASGTIVATSWYTTSQAVLEVVFEVIDVTVTAAATGSADPKRHLAAHKHRHGQRRQGAFLPE